MNAKAERSMPVVLAIDLRRLGGGGEMDVAVRPVDGRDVEQR